MNRLYPLYALTAKFSKTDESYGRFVIEERLDRVSGTSVEGRLDARAVALIRSRRVY